MCGTGVESSRVESGGGPCSVNVFFVLWAVVSRVVTSVFDSVVLCVVVVVATCLKMLTLFSERVSLVPLDSLVSLLNRYWFDLYAHSWLHLKDDDHIDM